MAKAQAKAKRKKRPAQSPSRYRAAIIGCGSMAGSHARGYSGVDAIDLVAGADPDEARGQRFSREFGVPKIYGDYREMLDRERPDIVSVCTWHPLHAEMTISAAARQPKAILTEKPMATSLGEAEEMMIACQRNQVKLAIGSSAASLGPGRGPESSLPRVQSAKWSGFRIPA